jgi:hypothetical protein
MATHDGFEVARGSYYDGTGLARAKGFKVEFTSFRSDAVPPTLEAISPAEGQGVRASQPIIIKISDERAVSVVEIFARFGNAAVNQYELVFGDDSFTDLYATSDRDVVSGPPVEHTFTIERSGGWPPDETVRLRVTALDAGGNLAVLS